MFSICLLLIALIAIAIAAEQKLSNAKQAEFIPIPVRVNKAKNFGSQHLNSNVR